MFTQHVLARKTINIDRRSGKHPNQFYASQPMKKTFPRAFDTQRPTGVAPMLVFPRGADDAVEGNDLTMLRRHRVQTGLGCLVCILGRRTSGTTTASLITSNSRRAEVNCPPLSHALIAALKPQQFAACGEQLTSPCAQVEDLELLIGAFNWSFYCAGATYG